MCDFVSDQANRRGFEEGGRVVGFKKSRRRFHFFNVQEEELKDAILLVFANKQDQPGSLGAKDVSEALRLTEIRNRQWSIQETCALKGNGLFEGFDWLVMCISGGEVQ
jgi:signal recognition particle receptor subunit beta